MRESLLNYRELKYMYLKRHPNEHTQKLYDRSLVSFRNHMHKFAPGLCPIEAEFRDIRDCVEDWAFTLTAKVKPITARQMLAPVSGFYWFLISEQYIELDKNPAAEIPIWDDEVRKPLSFPDAKLADKFELCLRKDAESGNLVARRNWLMFRFLTEGGFRAFELCNLRMEDVDIDTGKVYVVRGKGNKPRTTMVLPETGQFLAEFAKDYNLEDEDYLFMHRHMYHWETERKRLKGNGIKPLSESTLSKTLYRRAMAHGFNEGDVAELRAPHGYRHLWAARHVEAGTNHAAIMLMAGWKSIGMLLRYVEHATPGLTAIER